MQRPILCVPTKKSLKHNNPAIEIHDTDKIAFSWVTAAFLEDIYGGVKRKPGQVGHGSW